MSPPWEALADAVDQGNAERVHEATDGVRRRLREAFEGRAVTRGSLLVERRRRLEHALAELDDAVTGRRAKQARRHADTIRELTPKVLDEARRLDDAGAATSSRLPEGLANVLTIARKETVVGLRSTRGLLLFGLLLVTFGIGLQSVLAGSSATGSRSSVRLVWNYAHSLDFLAIPLAGILVGHGLVNEELRSDTIHVLAAQPVGRAGIVAGKWLGMAATLTMTVAASAGLVGAAAYAATGTLGRPGVVVAYPLACLLLALAFGSIALLASTLFERTGPTLAAGLGAFVVLGPVWQNAFLTRSLEQSASIPDAGEAVTYLATPFTAWWNWTSELLGPVNEATGLPQGEPWHAALVTAVERGQLDALPVYATQPYYVLVLVAWILACLAVAALVFHRRDLA